MHACAKTLKSLISIQKNTACNSYTVHAVLHCIIRTLRILYCIYVIIRTSNSIDTVSRSSTVYTCTLVILYSDYSKRQHADRQCTPRTICILFHFRRMTDIHGRRTHLNVAQCVRMHNCTCHKSLEGHLFSVSCFDSVTCESRV